MHIGLAKIEIIAQFSKYIAAFLSFYCFIPTAGTSHSHRGNNPFPSREHFVNYRLAVSQNVGKERKKEFCRRPNMLFQESPCTKGF
jgi:hypothetical protein